MGAGAERIGFLQGRLSPQVAGRIQAFPWAHWREEFAVAERLGFCLMEWTLDHARLDENPLMTPAGRHEIGALAAAHKLRVGALTGDLFMQVPFWKADAARAALVASFDAVLDGCAAAGISTIVVPLVDNGSLTSPDQVDALAQVLLARAERLRRDGLVIAFESDLAPDALAAFIADYPQDAFGITYDIGNSAALGYDCRAELAAYLPRVVHVHIKDRLRGGSTVPLGTGSARLATAIALLEVGGYRGNYVLQTARAGDGDHAGALVRYRAMALAWLDAAR
jgi:hexulose-6-phosphate isomerase